MPKDVANIQRDLANLQRQIKQMTDRAKKEEDPKRKADLQKKIIDMNVKRSELDKEMEDAVADMHAGSGLDLTATKGFTKWNKYKMKKLTESEKLKVKEFAKKLVDKKVLKEDKLDSWQLAQKISNYFVDNGLIRPNKKTTQLIKDLVNIIDGKGDIEKYKNKF